MRSETTSAGGTRPPVLEIKGLTVRLPKGADREFAIEDVSLTVGSGEIVCIVGESGSGKSVTAFTVMGLIPRRELTPVAGEVHLDGVDLLKQSEQQLRRLRGEKMAMIFQEPMTALNPVMKVGDQIAEAYRIHTSASKREARARALEMLETVQIREPEKVYRMFPHQVSGGMGQRVMIAMMLIPNPDIIIADEPTSALDVTVQMQVLALLDDMVRDRGMGLILRNYWGCSLSSRMIEISIPRRLTQMCRNIAPLSQAQEKSRFPGETALF